MSLYKKESVTLRQFNKGIKFLNRFEKLYARILHSKDREDGTVLVAVTISPASTRKVELHSHMGHRLLNVAYVASVCY